MTEQELLDLKQSIGENKAKITKLESRKELLLEQLYETFAIKSLPAAKKKVISMEADIKEYQKQIDEATAELEKRLQND